MGDWTSFELAHALVAGLQRLKRRGGDAHRSVSFSPGHPNQQTRLMARNARNYDEETGVFAVFLMASHAS